MVFKNGRWRLLDRKLLRKEKIPADKVCAQIPLKKYRTYVNRLDTLKKLQEKIVPNLKAKVQELKNIDKSWQRDQNI
ncbi:MAG: hypothetical protein AAGM67_22105, partial [Bacteroidota bacterium]